MLSMNQLYPIFLKTESLQFLIVGGGNVALEKLEFLLGELILEPLTLNITWTLYVCTI